jgi:excisionase family DNA binding protein
MSSHMTPTPATAERYLRPKAIVARFGVSEPTVRRWIADGTLESVRVGRNVFVPVESLERLFGKGNDRDQ